MDDTGALRHEAWRLHSTWTFRRSLWLLSSTACVPMDQVYAAICCDESTNLVQQLLTLRLVIHFHRLHLNLTYPTVSA